MFGDNAQHLELFSVRACQDENKREKEKNVEKQSVDVNYVNNTYIHPLYGKLQEKQLQLNEPYQVQTTAGNGPCLGLPLGW